MNNRSVDKSGLSHLPHKQVIVGSNPTAAIWPTVEQSNDLAKLIGLPKGVYRGVCGYCIDERIFIRLSEHEDRNYYRLEEDGWKALPEKHTLKQTPGIGFVVDLTVA